jgi:hypothetical protein
MSDSIPLYGSVPANGAEPEAPAAAAPPWPEAAVSTEPEAPESEDKRTAREKLIDALTDSKEAGEQSVAQLLAATGLERGLLESTISRAVARGLVLRTGPGHYVIAPPPLPKPKAPSERPKLTSDIHPIVQWREWLDTWFATHKWEGPGAAPGSPDFVAPVDVLLACNLRDAPEKERDAAEEKATTEKVAAAQAIGDAKLLEKLLAAVNGNFVPGARICDLTPVRVMLANGADLEDLLATLESRVDRRAAPDARPLTSWSDHWLLRAVACTCLQRTHVLRIVDSWLGKMESGTADASRASAAVEPGSAARAREVLRQRRPPDCAAGRATAVPCTFDCGRP